jgi:hypothetical protein
MLVAVAVEHSPALLLVVLVGLAAVVMVAQVQHLILELQLEPRTQVAAAVGHLVMGRDLLALMAVQA